MKLFHSIFPLAVVFFTTVLIVLCILVDGRGLRKGTRWSVALLWTSMLISALLSMLPEVEVLEAVRTPEGHRMLLLNRGVVAGIMVGAYLVLLLSGDFLAFWKAVNAFFGKAERPASPSGQ